MMSVDLLQKDPAFKFLEVSGTNSIISDPSLEQEWVAKKLVWIPHETQGFVSASVRQEEGDDVVIVEVSDTGETRKVSKDDIQKMNPPKFTKKEDMSELSNLNEASVLHNLRDRYYSDLIYTYSGLFCVVVNPYKRLPIYNEPVIEAYKGKKRSERPPHIYAIADQAYRSMLEARDDQSILCTGESGAGKTENTKKVIQYLAHVASSVKSQKTGGSTPATNSIAQSQGELELQLLQANPILEAFGNAKTIKNDNSSRFGKFIRINFDTTGFIAGANIETYLLEKARVIQQAKDERCFHIFYQLLSSRDEDLRSQLLLEQPSAYKYLSNGQLPVPGVDDNAAFEETLQAMDIMGIAQEERVSIFRVISAVLQLGSMVFKQDRNADQASMPDSSVAQKACHLLGLQVNDLVRAFLRPRIRVGREFVNKSQSQEQAVFAVEAISKAIYERLFRWLVTRINRSLDRSKARQSAHFIGILDIAGFEIFELNSFEQLCINYTNEKLQQLFNHTMFILEQEEYQKEGIEWKFIDFGLDLQPTIDLIEKTPMIDKQQMGIFAILDEECWFPKATDKSFVEKLQRNFDQHPKFAKASLKKSAINGFSVLHYAGRVDYSADNWLQKNQDPLNENVVAVLQNSSDQFVASLWKGVDNVVGLAAQAASETVFGQRTKKGMFRTVGQLYKEQLARLMSVLNNTSPNFVRCIIPNHEKRAGRLDSVLVLEQLRCNGVLEGIRICRQGYPNRILFHEFKQRYEILCPGAIPKGFMDGRQAVERMVRSLELDSTLYRIGQSKVFFRAGVVAFLEEERDKRLAEYIVGFQACARGFLARRACQKRIQQSNASRVIQRNCTAYLRLRNWAWWRLYTKVRPLLQVTRQEEVVQAKDAEIRQLREAGDRAATELADYKQSYAQLSAESHAMRDELQRERDSLAEAEDAREKLSAKSAELSALLEELRLQLEEEYAKCGRLESERRAGQQLLADTEEQLEASEEAKQKAQMEKLALEARVRELESRTASLDDQSHKLAVEKRSLEEQLSEISSDLAEEEERGRTLAKLKAKHESIIKELEERLQHEKDSRQDFERAKRRLESELAERTEELEEATSRQAEQQAQCARLEEELQRLQSRADEEAAARGLAQKSARDLEVKNSELLEDLDVERAARDRAEKQKRDLSEELEALKLEFEDQQDSNNVQQELNRRRNEEMLALKTALEAEQAAKETQLAEAKQRHARAIVELQEQLEAGRRARQTSEKARQQLETEATGLAAEAKSLGAAKQESDRKRKALEQRLLEVEARLQDSEARRLEQADLAERARKDAETSQALLEDAEARLIKAEKAASGLDVQRRELEAALEEETRQKLELQAKQRSAEESLHRLTEAHAESEAGRQQLERQAATLQAQAVELKRKAAEDAEVISELEEQRGKLRRDCEGLASRLEEAQAHADKMEKGRRKMAGEFDDLQHAKETLRKELMELERRHKKFDERYAELQARSAQLQADKDRLTVEARERESRILQLQAESADLAERLEDSERCRTAQSRELEELLASKDDAGKSAHGLERSKLALEAKLDEMQVQLEELEEELTISEDARLRLEVNLQAAKDGHLKELRDREDQADETRRQMAKQLKDLELEVEDERKTRCTAVSARKKMESDYSNLLTAFEDANQQKEEALKQLRKVQQAYQSLQQEAEVATTVKEDTVTHYKEAEKRLRHMDSERQQLLDDLTASERQRRALVSERDDLAEQARIAETSRTALAEETRRMETRLHQLEEDAEESAQEREEARDRLRRSEELVESLQSDLLNERVIAQKLEAQRAALDRQVKDLAAKLTELEQDSVRRAKAGAAALEARVATLEEQLDTEGKERVKEARSAKRLERRVKELQQQVDDERKASEQLRGQLDRMQAEKKKSKREQQDLEEELAQTKAHRRRLQRELEDLGEAKEALDRELAVLRKQNQR
uniref:Paramyosin n=1 Tax=Macrostomum lignano TaxID=282301 RepID=A0A1I8HGS0_9PLAT